MFWRSNKLSSAKPIGNPSNTGLSDTTRDSADFTCLSYWYGYCEAKKTKTFTNPSARMLTKRCARLGPGSSSRVLIPQAISPVSPIRGSCAVLPARRDELRLRLAGLSATAARLELGSTNPLDHPYKNAPIRCVLLCGPPGEIRTPDTQVRSLVLYPAELRAEPRSLGFPHKKVKEMSEQDGKTHHTSVSRRTVKYRKILGDSLKVFSHQGT